MMDFKPTDWGSHYGVCEDPFAAVWAICVHGTGKKVLICLPSFCLIQLSLGSNHAIQQVNYPGTIFSILFRMRYLDDRYTFVVQLFK